MFLTLFRWGHKAAQYVGCKFNENITEQINCLQQVDVETLANSPIQNGFSAANAVIDASYTGDPFLPMHPKTLMELGWYNYDKNVLLGCNR